MKYVKEKAYAKINLFLEVVGLRDDGYHNIETIMQSVSFGDDVSLGFEELPREADNKIEISCSLPYIPRDRRNIAYKAAEAFLGAKGIKAYVKIDIKKNIPVCAGLGGGSADGAAVLRALNSLVSEPMTTDELCLIGASIGADVPFCIIGGAAMCEGIGDKFTYLNSLGKELYVVVAKGKKGSSTPEAYSKLDSIENRSINPNCKKMSDIMAFGTPRGEELGKLLSLMYNSFECAVFPENSEAQIAKKTLEGYGADAALMSGSGSAVFGIFKDKQKAKEATTRLKYLGYTTFFGNPIPMGVM